MGLKQLEGGVSADFGKVAPVPTQLDKKSGIRYDFNDGLRIKTAEDDTVWRLNIYNAETCDLLASDLMPANTSMSFPFKYYIPYRFTMEASNRRLVEHTLSLRGRIVAFKMCQRTLGDPIAFFSYIPYFVQKHKCKAVVYAPKRIADIFRTSYPDIQFAQLEDECETTPYATYYLGLFFGEDAVNQYHQPYDFRLFGLHEQSKHILGLEESLVAAAPKCEIHKNKSSKKYVCISYSGSKANKAWWNPTGWDCVITYLKQQGYDVYCIDRDRVYGLFPYISRMPYGVIDATGDLPLQERIDLIAGADMLICMASGLAWLGWLARVPVVLISGFSLPYAEFYTPYRVINTLAGCIGCWNDTRIRFNRHVFKWCPRIDAKVAEVLAKMSRVTVPEELPIYEEELEGLEQQRFMCTKKISGNMVIQVIQQVLRDKKIIK